MLCTSLISCIQSSYCESAAPPDGCLVGRQPGERLPRSKWQCENSTPEHHWMDRVPMDRFVEVTAFSGAGCLLKAGAEAEHQVWKTFKLLDELDYFQCTSWVATAETLASVGCLALTLCRHLAPCTLHRRFQNLVPCIGPTLFSSEQHSRPASSRYS